ncbi:S-antigen protein [Collichthys lucidus]|uniref:S-antigen protein n=1 Tax=Collichthys lucidus TaxID=240159 RepID=A0A4U5U6W7_COLLU|nr:S-antigen protein [Collichthys lucidus]
MKTVLVLSILLCAAFAAPAEEQQKAPEEAPKEEMAAAPVSTILTSKKRSDEAVDVSEMEDMMKKDEEVSVPVDSVPEAAAPESRFNFCPDGWFSYNSRCFKFVNSATSWAGGCGLTVKVSITLTGTPSPPPAATPASTYAPPPPKKRKQKGAEGFKVTWRKRDRNGNIIPQHVRKNRSVKPSGSRELPRVEELHEDEIPPAVPNLDQRLQILRDLLSSVTVPASPEVEETPTMSAWTQRQLTTQRRFRAAMPELLNCKLAAETVTKKFCQQCKTADAVVRCLDCVPSGTQFLCPACDSTVHKKHVFHDREAMTGGFFQPIPPTSSVMIDQSGQHQLAEQVCVLPIPLPLQVCTCGTDQDFTIVPGKQTVLVTINGPYNLCLPVVCCPLCDYKWTPGINDLLGCRYWPATTSCQLLFKFDVFTSFEEMKLASPALSQQAFLRMLEHRSLSTGRKDDLCQVEPFKCPACTPDMLDICADGNRKHYRFKKSKGTDEPSLFDGLFIAQDAKVSAFVDKIRSQLTVTTQRAELEAANLLNLKQELNISQEDTEQWVEDVKQWAATERPGADRSHEELQREIDDMIYSLRRKKHDLYRQNDSNKTRQRKRRRLTESKKKLRERIMQYNDAAAEKIDIDAACSLSEDVILPWDVQGDVVSLRLKRRLFDQVMLVRRMEEERLIIVKEMTQHCHYLRKALDKLDHLLHCMDEDIKNHMSSAEITEEGYRGLQCCLLHKRHLLQKKLSTVTSTYALLDASSSFTLPLDEGKEETGGVGEVETGQEDTGGVGEVETGQEETGGVGEVETGQEDTGGVGEVETGQEDTGGVGEVETGQEDTGGVGEVETGQEDTGGVGEVETGQEDTGGVGEVETGQEDTRGVGRVETGQEETGGVGEVDTGQEDTGGSSEFAAGLSPVAVAGSGAVITVGKRKL